jgi:hypothetical protein
VFEGFLAGLVAFPTVLFAALSVCALVYWLLVILGAVELDALDGLSGKVEGLLEGAVDAVADGGSLFAEALRTLGFSRVPVTVSLTLFSFVGFFLAESSRELFDPLLPSWASAVVATVVAVGGGVGVTSLLTRPLRRFFADGGHSHKQGGTGLLGKTATITIDVDERGGQARVDQEIIVRVRAVGLQLPRGTEVVLMERDEHGVFLVEPVAALLPTDAQRFARLEADVVERSTSSVVETQSKGPPR